MKFLSTSAVILFLLAGTSVTAQTNEDKEKKVIGGTPTAPGAWPLPAFVTPGLGTPMTCGEGALMDPHQWVLTRIGASQNNMHGFQRHVLVDAIPRLDLLNPATAENDTMLLQELDSPVFGVRRFDCERSSSKPTRRSVGKSLLEIQLMANVPRAFLLGSGW